VQYYWHQEEQMRETATRKIKSNADVPDDLAILSERLSHIGLTVSLPNAVADHPLPELEKLDGTSLSELIIRERRAD
jgi:hypothetical protein